MRVCVLCLDYGYEEGNTQKNMLPASVYTAAAVGAEPLTNTSSSSPLRVARFHAMRPSQQQLIRRSRRRDDDTPHPTHTTPAHLIHWALAWTRALARFHWANGPIVLRTDAGV